MKRFITITFSAFVALAGITAAHAGNKGAKVTTKSGTVYYIMPSNSSSKHHYKLKMRSNGKASGCTSKRNGTPASAVSKLEKKGATVLNNAKLPTGAC